MIDLRKIIEFENRLPSEFADTCEKPYGRLFYNVNNPTSHDSNHAIITDLHADLDTALQEITSFYTKMGMKPRIKQSYHDGELVALPPFFEKHGFRYQEENPSILCLDKMGKLRSNSDICIEEVKSLTAGIADLNLSADGGEWSTKALQRHLLSDRLHHFVGFLDDKPVTMASLNIGDGLSNVDRVKTHKDHREKGYSSALISHLIHYHASVSKNPLYLLADNPIAIHMYKNAGFIDIEHSMTSWTAVKE